MNFNFKEILELFTGGAFIRNGAVITEASKIWFWIRYAFIMILFGVMSILSIVLFPIAFYIRYYTTKDWLWFLLNDETDFGEEWWLIKYNFSPGFWTSWLWNIRNSAWEFKTKVIIPKKGSLINKSVYTTVQNRKYDIDWPNKSNGKYGTLKASYRVKGKVYCRYGFANKNFEIQLGAAGNRYKLRLKL